MYPSLLSAIFLVTPKSAVVDAPIVNIGNEQSTNNKFKITKSAIAETIS